MKTKKSEPQTKTTFFVMSAHKLFEYTESVDSSAGVPVPHDVYPGGDAFYAIPMDVLNQYRYCLEAKVVPAKQ